MTPALTTRDLDLRHLWHGNAQHLGMENRPPLEMVAADDVWIEDSEGRRYLDAMAGLWCVNVGYGRREIVDAVTAQMTRMPYYPLTQSHTPGAMLAGRVAEMLPGELTRIFFTNSGSEAVETALKIARQSQRKRFPGQNRYKIIARHRGYHGFTLGAVACTGQAPRKAAFEPVLPGVLHVVPPDHYRCPFCKTQPGCSLACADEFDRVIRMEGPETVAAVILEPVIGGGGVFPAPDGYLESIRATCDRHGVLMIVDEVITGFGRTGKLFGAMHAGIKPDIMTMAKGLTSGYLPLGATAVTPQVFSAFQGTDPEKFVQVSTFGGHPASCAAGLANLDILMRERLWENSARVGAYLMDRLRSIDSPWAGEIRGRGLMMGIELVADKATREPLAESEVVAKMMAIRRAGVLVGRNNDTLSGNGNVLTISPPLTLTTAHAEIIADAVAGALR